MLLGGELKVGLLLYCGDGKASVAELQRETALNY